MMNNKFLQEIPAKSITYMLICGGIIILVVLLIIIPLYRYNSHQSQEVKNIQNQIDEQKGLGGVYQLLHNTSAKKDVHILPNPVKAKLSRQDLDKFQNTFRAETEQAGLTTISLIPDVNTMAAESKNIIYNAQIKGEFANFRNLLVKLGALSYIDQIEEINIKQYDVFMEFRMKIWIALAN